ncbi:Uncharacterised protein [uncultured archaeon]|nr:Uncharacterised protein [uncultured archaeon]
MGMSIRTSIFPIRMKFRAKEPWELNIEVKNEDPVQKKVSVAVDLPSQASFGTVGLTNRFEKQVADFRAGGTMQFKLPVYQSNSADAGYFSGKITVEEHPHGFEFNGRKITKELPFRIVA